MKKILVGVLMLAMGLAACGGGDGGGGTPTTPQVQAAAEAAIEATISAGGEAVLNALRPPGATQVVKASQTYVIDTTPVPCDSGDPTSGTYTATGTVTADCTGSGVMTCTITDGPAMILFTDCKKSVTISGTTYNEVLNGTATTNITGTVTGSSAGVTSINAGGNLGGTVTLTGDAPGTADLAGVSWTATGTPDPDPTIGCSGTATVTITGQAAATCDVASDCKGCSS